MVIEVKKKRGESSRSLTHRFSRAVRHSGLLRRIKEIQFYQRPPSKTRKKEKALRGLRIQEERERMRKLGKKLR